MSTFDAGIGQIRGELNSYVEFSICRVSAKVFLYGSRISRIQDSADFQGI